jgi:hypothetical protein
MLPASARLIHRATLLRVREKLDYSPPNSSRGFVEKIRGLAELPELLPYER